MITGKYITIETAHHKIIKGFIYTYDLSQDTLILQSFPENSQLHQPYLIHIIKISHIQQLVVDQDQTRSPFPQIRLPPLHEILSREQACIETS
jgi:hypothetical protein